jgi:hypothetical protein
MLTMVSEGTRLGYGRLVEKFWISARLMGVRLLQALPTHGSAFCNARMKLGWEFFRTLFQEAASKFEARSRPDCQWKGRAVFAVDGTKLALPRARALDEAFGRPKGAGRPMIAVVSLFNVFSRVTHDVAFGRYASGERVLIGELLDRVPAGSVLLLDRGYPGYRVFCELRKRAIDFVARVPTSSTFGAVMRFLATGRDRGHITLVPTRKGQPPNTPKGLDVRVVRKREGLEDIVLVTSLSAQTASRNELVQLYRQRWTIEGSFKVLKVDGFGQDSFHSETPEGIKQEICARFLFLNLTRHLLAHAAAQAGRPVVELSPKAARGALANTDLLVMIVMTPKRTCPAFPLVLVLIGRSMIEQRKGRTFPRVSHRPSLRWDAAGKTSRRGH